MTTESVLVKELSTHNLTHSKSENVSANLAFSPLVLLNIYYINLYIQFIDLVTPENSRCVQCDGTGYLYLEETGECQGPESQLVNKR